MALRWLSLGTSVVGGFKCVTAGAAQILSDLKNTAYYTYNTLRNSHHVFHVVRLVVIVICRTNLNFVDNQQYLRFLKKLFLAFIKKKKMPVLCPRIYPVPHSSQLRSLMCHTKWTQYDKLLILVIKKIESTVLVEIDLGGKWLNTTHTHTQPYTICVVNSGWFKTKQLPTRQMVDFMVFIAHVQTSDVATKPLRLYSELDV